MNKTNIVNRKYEIGERNKTLHTQCRRDHNSEVGTEQTNESSLRSGKYHKKIRKYYVGLPQQLSNGGGGNCYQGGVRKNGI